MTRIVKTKARCSFGLRRQVRRDGVFGWAKAVVQACIIHRRKSGVASDLPPHSKNLAATPTVPAQADTFPIRVLREIRGSNIGLRLESKKPRHEPPQTPGSPPPLWFTSSRCGFVRPLFTPASKPQSPSPRKPEIEAGSKRETSRRNPRAPVAPRPQKGEGPVHPSLRGRANPGREEGRTAGGEGDSNHRGAGGHATDRRLLESTPSRF